MKRFPRPGGPQSFSKGREAWKLKSSYAEPRRRRHKISQIIAIAHDRGFERYPATRFLAESSCEGNFTRRTRGSEEREDIFDFYEPISKVTAFGNCLPAPYLRMLSRPSLPKTSHQRKIDT
jgi:hypothetical protein